MDIRGFVITNLTRMVTSLKAVLIAVVSKMRMLWKTIGACIISLVTLSVNSLQRLVSIAWNTVLKAVPSTIQEDFNKVDNLLAVRRLGLIGRHLLTTVLLIPLAALKHLSLGLWNALVALKERLVSKG